MSLRTDKVQLEIIIKGDKTRQEISQLETKAKGLAKELKRLPEGSDEFIRKSAEFKTVQKRLDELRNTIGLTGMTMRELRNKQRELNLALQNMDPRTPKYRELRAELTQVKARMAELNGQSRQTGFSMNKMAEGFNKYFAIFAAFTASITGVILGMRKMVDEFSNFEKKVSNLSAITGLQGDELNYLSDRAKELSVSTTDSGVKITKSADEIVDAFTKMGSARPELLQNKEALALVTEQALILAEAGSITLDEAIDAVAATMNQFNLTAEESVRAVNTLGAGSLVGSAEISDLTGSLKNVGTVAKFSNMSLEETVAVLEILGEKQLKGEEAGTMLRGSLLKLKEAGVGYQSGMFNLADALDEVNFMLSQVDTQLEKDAILNKMFGIHNITAGQILLSNVDKFESLTLAVTDTNVATEQAVINTSNHAASMEQAKNKAKVMSIEIGEKLAPAMMFSTNAVRKFILALFELPKTIRENRNLFILLGAALLIVYSRKIQLLALQAKEYLWGEKSIIQMYKNIKVKLAEALATQGVTAATTLQQKAVMLLNFAWKKFPLGMIIAGLTAMYFAFQGISRLINKQTNDQEYLNEVNQRANVIVQEERSQLMLLARELDNTNTGTAERKVVIDKINSAYGQYLPNLLTEKDSYDKIKNALFLVNAELLKKAKLQAISEKLVENEKKLIELQEKQYQMIQASRNTSSVKNFKDKQYFDASIDAYQNQIDLLNKQNQALIDIQGNMQAISNTKPAPNPDDPDLNPKEGDMQLIDDVWHVFKNGQWVPVKSSDPDSGKAADKWVNKYIDAEVELHLSYIRDVENLRHALNLKQISQDEYFNHLQLLYSRYRKQIADATETDDPLSIPDISANSGKIDHEEVMRQHDETLKKLEDERRIRMDIISTLINSESYSYSERLAALQRSHENGLILEDEYNQAVLDMKAEHLQKINDLYVQNAQKIVLDLANTIGTFHQAQYDKEITHINDKYNLEFSKLDQLYNSKKINEEDYQAEKKVLEDQLAEDRKELNIKQAKREAALKELEIGVGSAGTIFDISAQVFKYTASGNVPMAILAGSQIPLVIASSIAQIAAVEAAKNKGISEFASGKYPLMGQSGKVWNVGFGGRASTGYVSTPTHFIAGDGEPEMIIDYPTLRNIQLNAPEILSTIMQMRVPERASGQYPVAASASSSSGSTDPAYSSNSTALQIETLKILKAIHLELRNSYTFKDLYDKLDEVDQQYQQINEDFTA